jgi:hypothetical protein
MRVRVKIITIVILIHINDVRRRVRLRYMNHHEALDDFDEYDDFDEGVPAVERIIRRVLVWESW